MFNSKKFLPKILISFLFLAMMIAIISWTKIPKASAEANIPVTGYAWSENIGWVHFNPAFGGVFYNNTTGQLSGYAWSDNIGWVYFGPDKSNISASTTPNEPKQWAKASTTTGIVSGWAKTYRAIPDKTDANAEDGQTLGGWEGWIKMDHGMSNPVSIDFATGDFHGWAWSSDTAGIIGWISFNSKDCDLDNNGFIDIACGGKNSSTTPAYPYKVTIGAGNLTPTYTIEPSTASVSVGGTQRFIGWYDSDGSGSASSTDKTIQASFWKSSNTTIATIATTTGQAIAICSTAGTVAITSTYNSIPATASLTCTTGGGPRCGNGVKEAGEQCDDGNTNSGDSCSSSCTTEGCSGGCGNGYCGDGIKNGSEQCDDGVKNGTTLSQCTVSCQNTTCGGCGGSSTYEIRPKDPKIFVNEKQQFEGILKYANGFEETKTDVASWESVNALIPINYTDKKGLAFCAVEGNTTIKSTYESKNAQTGLFCEKRGGTITINPSPSTIKAVIIEGLPANSETTTLTINGCSDKNVTLTATSVYGTPSFSKNPVANGGTTVFSVKNVPGNTSEGTYPIKITGIAESCDAGSATVNLKVERIGSDWEEF